MAAFTMPGRLTARDMQILLDLLRQGPLTTDTICDHRFGGGITYCRERLYQLHRRGWLDRRTGAPDGRRRSFWQLSNLGRRTAESLSAQGDD